MDPAASPELFNSTLALIIKDVSTEREEKDIKKEFQSKLHQIVQNEQERNFISFLHRDHTMIVPWPVINSPAFYSRFSVLRRRLEKQDVTYSGGGVFLRNIKTMMAKIVATDWQSLEQNRTAHRSSQLREQLNTALSRGRIQHGADSWGPLKHLDTDEDLPCMELDAVFYVPELSPGTSVKTEDPRPFLRTIIHRYGAIIGSRHDLGEKAYTEQLQQQIFAYLDQRLSHVDEWLKENLKDSLSDNHDTRKLHEDRERLGLAMRDALQLCLAKCTSCFLQCTNPYQHPGDHDCATSHSCEGFCEITEGHSKLEKCGLGAGHDSQHLCRVTKHLCGKPCAQSKKGGCAVSCVKPLEHEDEHLCSARVHFCGEPCDLYHVGTGYRCPERCYAICGETHTRHACIKTTWCPIKCELCASERCCAEDHFHGLDEKAIHLCGREHKCNEDCGILGICRIETEASEVKSNFVGDHDAFEYTKYVQIQQREKCCIPIPSGERKHQGAHVHSVKPGIIHFCTKQCSDCGFYCTQPFGHSQKLHKTNHGSMVLTQWALQQAGPGAIHEIDSHKFGAGDEGAPLQCNFLCSKQGRHAHIDFCRQEHGNSNNAAEQQHINYGIQPEANHPKDWISHRLKWDRNGFEDPYEHGKQTEFAKCDHYCGGPEHDDTQRSYCKLPMFHKPHPHPSTQRAGYVSKDGHSFDCQDPARLNQAYHVVFAIDSSGSMSWDDHKPTSGTPVSNLIARHCNNRYGAAVSAVWRFCHSRESNLPSTQSRQDAYSAMIFDSYPQTLISNDFTSSAIQIVNRLIPQPSSGGTDFNSAFGHAKSLIQNNWSNDRIPVLIFLSDGEDDIKEDLVYELCRMCIQKGKPLEFYSISFGEAEYSDSLRTMARIAQSVYASAPADAVAAARGNPCAYSNAIDSIQLSNTFLAIADSLQKPRASLICHSRKMI